MLPPSVDQWLPEKHLARFVVEVIEGLDLSAMSRSYRGGSAPYHPALLLGMLVYGYATGVFSSRKLERATCDSVADNGYFSEATVKACADAGIDPLIAMGREGHHPSPQERFAPAPPAPENPTPVEAMAHRLRTPEGKKLDALRKQTPEPVFGIIKSVLGFRQFLLRGLDGARGEWRLVTMAWNLKRMFALSLAG